MVVIGGSRHRTSRRRCPGRCCRRVAVVDDAVLGADVGVVGVVADADPLADLAVLDLEVHLHAPGAGAEVELHLAAGGLLDLDHPAAGGRGADQPEAAGVDDVDDGAGAGGVERAGLVGRDAGRAADGRRGRVADVVDVVELVAPPVVGVPAHSGSAACSASSQLPLRSPGTSSLLPASWSGTIDGAGPAPRRRAVMATPPRTPAAAAASRLRVVVGASGMRGSFRGFDARTMREPPAKPTPGPPQAQVKAQPSSRTSSCGPPSHQPSRRLRWSSPSNSTRTPLSWDSPTSTVKPGAGVATTTVTPAAVNRSVALPPTRS